MIRILESTGHDLHDLARVVGTGGAFEFDKPEPPSEWVDIVERLLKLSIFTAWEVKFLNSILSQARVRPGFRLSAKQQSIFNGLLRKGG
jgi:hypothetical protein